MKIREVGGRLYQNTIIDQACGGSPWAVVNKAWIFAKALSVGREESTRREQDLVMKSWSYPESPAWRQCEIDLRSIQDRLDCKTPQAAFEMINDVIDYRAIPAGAMLPNFANKKVASGATKPNAFCPRRRSVRTVHRLLGADAVWTTSNSVECSLHS